MVLIAGFISKIKYHNLKDNYHNLKDNYLNSFINESFSCLFINLNPLNFRSRQPLRRQARHTRFLPSVAVQDQHHSMSANQFPRQCHAVERRKRSGRIDTRGTLRDVVRSQIRIHY